MNKWNTARWELGGEPARGPWGALLCPTFLVHSQETLKRKASKDGEHMFIL